MVNPEVIPSGRKGHLDLADPALSFARPESELIYAAISLEWPPIREHRWQPMREHEWLPMGDHGWLPIGEHGGGL